MMNKSKEILFEVTEDALLVANGGRSFSRTGVLSVCASHLSDKQSDGVEDNFDCTDSELVRAIRCRELNTYGNDPNRITTDFRDQDETVRDYGDRFVWELLQNADDAMGEEKSSSDLIGSKGLGFKSVLEITDEPEIHSGPFHFLFSATKTQKLLKDEGLQDGPPPLTFRIPHEREPSQEIQGFLDEGYATVIRLPFRDDEARNMVVDRLRSLVPLFLLLVHELSCVRVRTSEGETVLEIARDEPGLSTGDVMLSSSRRPDSFRLTQWRRWVLSEPLTTDNSKRLSVAICLPTDSGGVIPHDAEIPFHVFFPTEEKIGARALVHASLDLEHNRKRVRAGENDADILRVFKELFQEVLGDIPARTALEAFGKIAPEDENSPLERLREGIRETLRETPFVPVIGGERVRPGEVRLWSDRLGFVLRDDNPEVRDARLLAPELRELSGMLKRHFSAKDVEAENYIRLLRHCRNDSLKECLASWRAWAGGGLKRQRSMDREKSLESLRSVPCWWTEAGVARALDGDSPLLRTRPKDWPDWLPADALHPAMQKMVKRYEAKLKNDSGWKECISERLLNEKQEFLHCALLPFITEWNDERWKADGWGALRQVLSWSPSRKFEDVSPWIKSADGNRAEKQRAQVVRTLRLPTDKGWMPAADCYAGEACDGSPAFDFFFEGVDGRGIILPFQKWPDFVKQETDKDQWKPLLRWAGVSWEPKVRRVEWPSSSHRLMRCYEKDTNSQSATDKIHNWEVEHFPECMQDDDAKPADAIRMVLPLAEAVRKHRASYFYYSKKACDNFADFQLRHEKWLPCKRALLHDGERAAPREAFLPGEGLGGLLPEVDRRGIENEEWFQPFVPRLHNLGIRNELPKEPESWHGWMRKLPELDDQLDESERKIPESGEEVNLLWKAAAALYRRYLKLDGDHNGFPQDIPVPCLSWENDRETLAFLPPGGVFYVDKPHLDEVKHKIMQEGHKLFILSLGSGGNAPERLGMRPLSGFLEVEPHHGGQDERESGKLLERYSERRHGLSLTAKLNPPLPEDLDLIAVRGLKLKLTKSGKPVADVEVLSWRKTKGDPLLINLDKGEWRALGHGLAERIALRGDKASLFETLLDERDKEGYLDRLRQEGVTEDDIKHVESTWNYEPQLQEGSGDTSGPTRKDDLLPGDGDDSHPSEEEEGRRPKRPTLEPFDKGGTREPGGGGEPLPPGGKGGKQGPNPETGRAAEDWFKERLEEVFLPGCVTRGERDKENRESDFVVVINDDAKLHIEVKHAASRPATFYWSGLEYEKARDLEEGTDKYVMAILSPDGEEGYEIRWIWRPLDELMEASRDVQWMGNSDYESVKADSWDVTEQWPDEVPTKRYVFRLKLNDEILENLDEDTGSLDVLREKINEDF